MCREVRGGYILQRLYIHNVELYYTLSYIICIRSVVVVYLLHY